MATRRFPLHAPRTTPWLIALFSFAAVAFAVALVIDSATATFDELGVTGSRVLYGALCVCSVAVVVVVVAEMRAMRGGKVAIELDDLAIVVPRPLLRSRTRRFLFSEITKASIFAFGGHEVLMIAGRPGRAGISRSELRGDAFDSIVAHVATRVPAPRSSLPVAKVR